MPFPLRVALAGCFALACVSGCGLPLDVPTSTPTSAPTSTPTRIVSDMELLHELVERTLPAEVLNSNGTGSSGGPDASKMTTHFVALEFADSLQPDQIITWRKRLEDEFRGAVEQAGGKAERPTRRSEGVQWESEFIYRTGQRTGAVTLVMVGPQPSRNNAARDAYSLNVEIQEVHGRKLPRYE